jgi:DNA (cytosine-5)-methyltransferase 1
MGYSRAGFEVVGVDINPQPRYPFEFHQGDALAFLRKHGHEFDAVHASPPCQRYSQALNCRPGVRELHPDLLASTRRALKRAGKPYVIENVPSSPMKNYVTLCGLTFGLRIWRHRWFETTFHVEDPGHIKHKRGAMVRGEIFSVFGHPGGTHSCWRRYKLASGKLQEFSRGTAAEWCAAMGIDWMDRKTLPQAIPPAYSEYIGRALMASFTQGRGCVPPEAKTKRLKVAA